MLDNKQIPYICVPLTGKNEQEIKEELAKTLLYEPDVIEWRIDFMEGPFDENHLISIVDFITSTTNIPLLATIRSEKEGGNPIPLTEVEKLHLLLTLCEQTDVAFIDFELSNDPEHIKAIRNKTNEKNKKLILSYHHFSETPSNEFLKKIVQNAVEYNGDIAKIAVMPNNKDDVLRLLQLTNKMTETPNLPLITMSMGKLGAISRMIGWMYGSIMTFAVSVNSSAPGQIHIEALKKYIQQTKEVLK